MGSIAIGRRAGWWVVAILVSLPVVARADDAAKPAATATVKVLKDLPYKAGEGLDAYERERCKLDLYLPEGAKGFATVVWFYGGGMEGGEKGGRGNVNIATT